MPYIKYIKNYWKGFLGAIFFLIVEAAVDLTMPTILAFIIDRGILENDMNIVLRMGGLMLLISLLGAFVASMRNVLAVYVSQKFGTELRSDLFRKIQSFSFENMDRFKRASLITRMTNDITIVQHFMGGLMRIFVKAPLLGIGAVILAVQLNPQLSLVFAVVIPIVAVLVAISMKVGFSRFMKVQQSLDRVNAVVREYLSGVRVVKAFNRFDYEMDKFSKTNAEQKQTSVSAMRAMALFHPAIMLVVNLGVVAIIWIGGLWIDRGIMQQNQVGEIVAFINYMIQILFSLMMISMVFTMFVRARASTQRINEVFAQQSELSWNPQLKVNDLKDNHIAFEDVSFTYAGAGGPPVLRGITFQCAAGATIGIIGSTGAGKSSLVGLIPRFYDVSSGSVKIGGTDVKELDPVELRKKIAVVPQQSVLFSGTVMENICMGNEEATLEEVQLAAKMAEAHEFIDRLPEGYDARIGQKGVNLSGGQKQRLSIARALVRKPDILILDDCTSAVDTATESRIKESLKRFSSGLTCLLITQRIRSVMDADLIIVMDLGEIVGMGSHESLMKECQIYQEIYKSQIGEEVKLSG